MKPGDEPGLPEPPANLQVHMAWMRTRMALERTLDAWVRTAAALIGFGFTLVKFFERLDILQHVPANSPHPVRYVGLLLIGIGTFALVIAIWQYLRVVQYLWSETFRGAAGVPGMCRLYPALVIAVLLCIVGLLAFIGIVASKLPESGTP